jgi:hypothetical protein
MWDWCISVKSLGRLEYRCLIAPVKPGRDSDREQNTAQNLNTKSAHFLDIHGLLNNVQNFMNN